VVVDGKFGMIRVVAGGIAPVPLRLSGVERAATGAAVTAATAGGHRGELLDRLRAKDGFPGVSQATVGML